MGPRTICWRKAQRNTISTQFCFYLAALRTILLSKTWRDTISTPFCFYSTLLRTNCEWNHKQTLSAILSKCIPRRENDIHPWRKNMKRRHSQFIRRNHARSESENTRHREHSLLDLPDEITYWLWVETQGDTMSTLLRMYPLRSPPICGKNHRKDTSAHISWPFCIFPMRWRMIWG